MQPQTRPVFSKGTSSLWVLSVWLSSFLPAACLFPFHVRLAAVLCPASCSCILRTSFVSEKIKQNARFVAWKQIWGRGRDIWGVAVFEDWPVNRHYIKGNDNKGMWDPSQSQRCNHSHWILFNFFFLKCTYNYFQHVVKRDRKSVV